MKRKIIYFTTFTTFPSTHNNDTNPMSESEGSRSASDGGLAPKKGAISVVWKFSPGRNLPVRCMAQLRLLAILENT